MAAKLPVTPARFANPLNPGPAMSYTQARQDFEFLETLAELDDQVELDAERLNLMRNPTKAFAERIYRSAIALWFQEHGSKRWPNEYYRVIAGRYGIRLKSV